MNTIPGIIHFQCVQNIFLNCLLLTITNTLLLNFFSDTKGGGKPDNSIS